MNDFETADRVRSIPLGDLPHFLRRFIASFAAGLLLSLPLHLWLEDGVAVPFADACLTGFVTVRTHKATQFLSLRRFFLAVAAALLLTIIASHVIRNLGWDLTTKAALSQTLMVVFAVGVAQIVVFLRVCLGTPGSDG